MPDPRRPGAGRPCHRTALGAGLLAAVATHASALGPPPVPAFPGAEGAGRWSQGGRGGRVYTVTHLGDDGPRGEARFLRSADLKPWVEPRDGRKRFVEREGLQACAVLPMRLASNKEPVGVLFVNHCEDQDFPTDQREAMRALVSSAAIAIQTARLRDRAERSRAGRGPPGRGHGRGADEPRQPHTGRAEPPPHRDRTIVVNAGTMTITDASGVRLAHDSTVNQGALSLLGPGEWAGVTGLLRNRGTIGSTGTGALALNAATFVAEAGSVVTGPMPTV